MRTYYEWHKKYSEPEDVTTIKKGLHPDNDISVDEWYEWRSDTHHHFSILNDMSTQKNAYTKYMTRKHILQTNILL